MKIEQLELKNYRNYKNLSLCLNDNINIFIGKNAQGKTNIVEAVYFAAIGCSYRSNNDGDIIHWGEEQAKLLIECNKLNINNRIEVCFQKDKKKQILYNGEKIYLKDLIGKLNMVLFSPEDLFLIKGAPVERRKFLDMEISQANPMYYKELINYNHILSQRNTLLKKIKEDVKSRKIIFSREILSLWDVQLAKSASKLVIKRLETIKKLNMLANLMQRRISGNIENLSVSYQIKGMENQRDIVDNKDVEAIFKKLEIWYNKVLSELAEEDMWRGSTSVGPHRDDISICVNGIDLKKFGSQGQQRTGVLSLKLSELEFIRSETRDYPILLLDDVMSELDANRRQKLLEFIKKENIQTIITATDMAYFPKNFQANFVFIENGAIRE